MKGIYKYADLETGDIVYIGKDSHIDKHSRHMQHKTPYNYDEQPFNRVLQNNLDRYRYSVLWAEKDCTALKLNKMEILFGKIFNPKFNFGKLGKGGCTKHSEETKQKMSENNARYWKGKNRPNETKKKMSDAHKGNKLSDETKYKLSEIRNTSSYFRVTKHKNKKLKQGYNWVYQYYGEDGKQKNISSVDIEKLEEKVKAKDLEWREL